MSSLASVTSSNQWAWARYPAAERALPACLSSCTYYLKYLLMSFTDQCFSPDCRSSRWNFFCAFTCFPDRHPKHPPPMTDGFSPHVPDGPARHASL